MAQIDLPTLKASPAPARDGDGLIEKRIGEVLKAPIQSRGSAVEGGRHFHGQRLMRALLLNPQPQPPHGEFAQPVGGVQHSITRRSSLGTDATTVVSGSESSRPVFAGGIRLRLSAKSICSLGFSVRVCGGRCTDYHMRTSFDM